MAYGIGGAALGAVAGLFAYHFGLPDWQATLIGVLVAVGVPTLLTGRLNNW